MTPTKYRHKHFSQNNLPEIIGDSSSGNLWALILFMEQLKPTIIGNSSSGNL